MNEQFEIPENIIQAKYKCKREHTSAKNDIVAEIRCMYEYEMMKNRVWEPLASIPLMGDVKL